jgi:hypothetical protein
MEACLNLNLPGLLRLHCIILTAVSAWRTDVGRVSWYWGLERGCWPTQLYLAVFSDSVCLWHGWLHSEHCPLSEPAYVSAYVVNSCYLKSTDWIRQNWEGTSCGFMWRYLLEEMVENHEKLSIPEFPGRYSNRLSFVNDSETLTFQPLCSMLSNSNHIYLLLLILSRF